MLLDAAALGYPAEAKEGSGKNKKTCGHSGPLLIRHMGLPYGRF